MPKQAVSVKGTLRIDDADPGLVRADAAIRALFRASGGRAATPPASARRRRRVR